MKERKTPKDETIGLDGLLLLLREKVKKGRKAWLEQVNAKLEAAAKERGPFDESPKRITESHLSRVLNRKEDPNAALLQALGFEVVPKRYRKVVK